MVVRLTQDIPPEIVKLGPQVVGFFQSILDNLGSTSSGSSGVSQADFDALEVRVDDLEGGTPSYTSSNQTITAATQIVLSHGLGAIPSKIYADLICLTSEYGYAVGEVVAVSPYSFGYTSVGGGAAIFSLGAMIGRDATNITIDYAAGNAGAVFWVVNRVGSANIFLTNASWALRVRAEL